MTSNGMTGRVELHPHDSTNDVQRDIILLKGRL